MTRTGGTPMPPAPDKFYLEDGYMLEYLILELPDHPETVMEEETRCRNSNSRAISVTPTSRIAP